MTQNKFPLILDGHNDTILKIHAYSQIGVELSFLDGNSQCHIDLPRSLEGGLGGGFFAVYTPNELHDPTVPSSFPGDDDEDGAAFTYQMPLPPALEHPYSLRFTLELAQKLFALEAASEGKVKIVRNSAELAHCLANGIYAIIFHIEGAEAIDADMHALHTLHTLGLRSLGIVWSRPTIFGEGVPFHFPAHPDIGEGLTDAGKRLVRECNQLRIMLDCSHLNEKGFWDVAKLSDAPLVCTHSGAHAMAQSPRNLLDTQLDAIKETNGVVGVVYHAGFLREDGRGYRETSVTEIVRHAAYIAERIGVEHVALGSDFDGAKMPDDLVDAAGLPNLMTALKAHGFSAEDLEKIAHKNWLRVLNQTWGE